MLERIYFIKEMTLLNLSNNVGVDVIVNKAVTTFNCNNKEIDSQKI